MPQYIISLAVAVASGSGTWMSTLAFPLLNQTILRFKEQQQTEGVYSYQIFYKIVCSVSYFYDIWSGSTFQIHETQP